MNQLKKVLKQAQKILYFFQKVKYLLQKLLDNSELWLETLLSSIESGFQLEKNVDRPTGPIVAASGKQGCTL